MNREPKVSEIEKLINHFRKTDREDELFEVLDTHGIGNHKKDLEAIDPKTHEISEEAIAVENIAKKEGLKIHEYRPLKKIADAWKYKWIFRYSVYYVFLFCGFMLFLNAPMIMTMAKGTDESKSRILTVQEIEKYKMEPSASLDPGEVITPGSRLMIPKIGVDAPIIMAASNDEATIQNDLTKGVVHYKDTAEPGQIGNSFITGHSSNFWWIKGSYNYIFVNLSKMAIGDQAKIYHNGNKFVYQVKEIKEVLPADTSVLAQGDTPTLTLMTCTPAGTNWRRLIVIFDQVSPKYVKPRVITKQIIDENTLLPSTDTNSVGGVALSIVDGVKKIFGY